MDKGIEYILEAVSYTHLVLAQLPVADGVLVALANPGVGLDHALHLRPQALSLIHI